MGSQLYGKLSTTKQEKISNGKRQSLQQWCSENWTATCKGMKLYHFLTSCTKVNSKWIEDLNVRPETIKILEEITGNNFSDIGHSNIFLDMSLEESKIKAKRNYWDYIKIKYSA